MPAPSPEDNRQSQIAALRAMMAGGEPRDDISAGQGVSPLCGTSPEWEKLESQARSIALRRLGRSAQSRHQLSEAMAKHEVPHEVAESVLDRFEEVGLVNDVEFANTLVRTRHKERGLVGQALRQELRKYGIDRNIADTVMSNVSREDEEAAATALARKKLESTRGLGHDVRMRRTMSLLARKGYNPGLASAVIRRILDEE